MGAGDLGGVVWSVVGEGFTVGHGSVSQLTISLARGAGGRPAVGACVKNAFSVVLACGLESAAPLVGGGWRRRRVEFPLETALGTF